ncbi:MAG: flagellar hook-length control protein FliK [Blastocatellia bacterium]|nr:flagellar hook-length control protein FliK [Blastocatellia bacterium]
MSDPLSFNIAAGPPPELPLAPVSGVEGAFAFATLFDLELSVDAADEASGERDAEFEDAPRDDPNAAAEAAESFIGLPAPESPAEFTSLTMLTGESLAWAAATANLVAADDSQIGFEWSRSPTMAAQRTAKLHELFDSAEWPAAEASEDGAVWPVRPDERVEAASTSDASGGLMTHADAAPPLDAGSRIDAELPAATVAGIGAEEGFISALPSGLRERLRLQWIAAGDVRSISPATEPPSDGAIPWAPDSKPSANGTPFASASFVETSDPSHIAAQLAEPVLSAGEGLSVGESHTLRLKLRPGEWGEVDVEISRDEAGRVNAHLTVENETAGRVLSDDLGQLRESLERAGLPVGELDVSTGPTPGWAFHEQARHRGDPPPPRVAAPDDSGPAQTLNGGAAAAQDRLVNLHA